MNEQQQKTNTTEVRQRQNGLWTSGIFALLGLAFFFYDLYVVFILQGGRFDLSDSVLMPVAAMMVLMGVASLLLILRGRLSLGTNLLFYFFVLIPPVIAVLLLQSIASVVVLYIVLLAAIMIGWVLPRASRRSAILSAVIAIVLCLAIEYWDPGFRVATELGIFANIATGLVSVIILALIVRQTVTGNINNKLSTSFVVITIVSVLIVAIPANRSLSTSLTTIIGNRLADQANAQGQLIATVLDREMAALSTLSLSKTIQSSARSATLPTKLSQTEIDLRDQQWRVSAMANPSSGPVVNDPLLYPVIHNPYADELRGFQKQFNQHVEVFVTGTQGFSVASTNVTSDYYQADEEWWQVAYRDGKYIGQPEYDESTKTIAINMAVAIREFGDGRLLGVLRTTVDITTLINAMTATTIGQTGQTIILLPSGREIRLNLKEDGTYEMAQEDISPELITLSQSTSKYQSITLNGIPVLASIADVRGFGDTEEDTRTVSNLHWRVATIQDSAEALQPITTQTRNITILALAIITVVSFAGRFLANLISGPIIRLNAIAEKVATGNLNVEAKVETRDEVGILATTFNSMIARLRDFISTLESRVAERTRSLELAAEVGRSVSQVRALDVMLKEAAEIIRSRFDLYYVQVYLNNPAQNTLLLQSGTGKVGAELVGRGHKLPLDTGSINGLAAVEKQSVVISDTAASATFRPNPLLPDTRSEMAVPLLIGDKVVGVLDLQSRQAGMLNKDLLPAYEALAGQLAIAIQNANLLAETEQARTEVEKQAKRLVRVSWEEYLDAIHRPEKTGFVYEQNQVRPLDETEETPPRAEGSALITPIAVSGEPLGTLVVEMEDQSPQNVELVQIVARQVAQQIENLRLLESAEQYRYEAEEASRRTTIEGWKQYIESRSGKLGYLYDSNTVQLNGTERKTNEPAMTLPIKVREETVGKLSVMGLESKDNDSLELANAVAERLGTHIENLRLIEETRTSQVELDQRARQLAAVAEISTASSRELDIDKMLHTVVHLTQRQFGLYHAHIFLLNENTQNLKIAACGWKEGDIHEGTDGTAVIPMDQEQSLVARAARTRQAVIVNDVENEPAWLPNPLLPDTKSELAVPLVIGDQLLGILDVQSGQLNAFTEEDANIQATLAAQVATSLQNARSYKQAQQQAERESMLNAISQKIQGATSVEAVLQIAARELGHALGAPLTIAQLGMKDGNK